LTHHARPKIQISHGILDRLSAAPAGALAYLIVELNPIDYA
jgi:hypothetical protein